MSKTMPGAKWLPIPRNYGGKRKTTNAAVLHVDGGDAPSLQGWFSNSNAGVSSHFFVTHQGVIEQYVDADLIAWANKDGNHRTISIETQGRADGKWTPEACESLAQIIAWVHKNYGVPLRLMESSKSTETGVGWHRLGVDGNFPSSGLLRGRKQRGGGELWSSTNGKPCPGSDRIPQIAGIVARAQRISSGAPTPPAPIPRRDPLVVDGYAGHATTRALQALAGTPQDGVISGQPNRIRTSARIGRVLDKHWPTIKYGSGGSLVIGWIQRTCGAKVDRVFGPLTVAALQRKLGVKADSSPGPVTVKALQRAINDGTF